jgi:transcriptional regulator with XRE-family HTH domain
MDGFDRVRIALMTFGVWLNEEYLKYQLRAGGKLPLSSFAVYLDVNPSTLSSWLCGDRSPNRENQHKLAEKLGQRVFTILQGKYEPELYGINSIPTEMSLSSLSLSTRESVYLTPCIR